MTPWRLTGYSSVCNGEGSDEGFCHHVTQDMFTQQETAPDVTPTVTPGGTPSFKPADNTDTHLSITDSKVFLAPNFQCHVQNGKCRGFLLALFVWIFVTRVEKMRPLDTEPTWGLLCVGI